MAQELSDRPPKPVASPVPVVLHLLLIAVVVEVILLIVIVMVMVVVVVVTAEEEVRLLELADHPPIAVNAVEPRRIHLMDPRPVELPP